MHNAKLQKGKLLSRTGSPVKTQKQSTHSFKSVIRHHSGSFANADRRVSTVIGFMMSVDNEASKIPQLTVHHKADSPVPLKSLLHIGKQLTTESNESLTIPPLGPRPTTSSKEKRVEERVTEPKQCFVKQESVVEVNDISSPQSAESSEENDPHLQYGSAQSSMRERSSLPTPRVTVETLPNMPLSSRVMFEKDSRRTSAKSRKFSKIKDTPKE